MVTITEDELRGAVSKMLERILEWPEINIDNLYEIASILLTIGICKGSTSFKLLADHIVSLPERLKPILIYPYQLAGVAGELKDKYTKLAEGSLEQLREIISNSLDALSTPKIDEKKVLEQVEKARTLLSSLPRFPRFEE